jgi:endonuclease-8
MPVVELIPTDREADVVGHLGPDVLGPDWDLDRAVANIRREPDAEIGNALLDQRNLAGVGNLYRTEALFLRGISPWTPITDVPDLPAVVALAAQLVAANRGHSTQSTTGDTRRGNTHHVFERQGLPCNRCGTPIRSARQGLPPQDRITYWCPNCQVGPSPTGNALRPRAFAGPAAAARIRRGRR